MLTHEEVVGTPMPEYLAEWLKTLTEEQVNEVSAYYVSISADVFARMLNLEEY
jgi:hypothetical protein